ncbi:hypothetical protein MAA_11731 [Metarhizium robertsii ARSEF 23]|uniref:Uncharacterized protein n=1 Tax=Metarhizium robertsii (strain ARSEF 23 / ATCC MYA-3075) TaxID=655844 RepID=A0A0B2XD93_METRA|nr:uncharacterized protein MAA_11731 [Metarhizium robertsii ARSEF 23]KHO10680.1 hypothetical protein MAA_11731 [Metarhizium robertsii ARSEF 23]
MTTLTPRKNPLRACHQGIAFVNDEPTCRHKKRMVRIPKGSGRRVMRKVLVLRRGRQGETAPNAIQATKHHSVSPTAHAIYRRTIWVVPRKIRWPRQRDRSNSPSRKPHQTNRSFRRQETAVASRSITIDRKRPISPDTQENSPLKKHQSGLQSAKDPAVRLLFPPTPYKRAANESHTDENDPSYFAGEDKFGKKSSDASSQTSNGGSRTSPRGVARVPLGNADINRV